MLSKRMWQSFSRMLVGITLSMVASIDLAHAQLKVMVMGDSFASGKHVNTGPGGAYTAFGGYRLPLWNELNWADPGGYVFVGPSTYQNYGGITPHCAMRGCTTWNLYDSTGNGYQSNEAEPFATSPAGPGNGDFAKAMSSWANGYNPDIIVVQFGFNDVLNHVIDSGSNPNNTWTNNDATSVPPSNCMDC